MTQTTKKDWKTVTDFLTIHGAYKIPEVCEAAKRIKDRLEWLDGYAKQKEKEHAKAN